MDGYAQCRIAVPSASILSAVSSASILATEAERGNHVNVHYVHACIVYPSVGIYVQHV